MEGDEGADEEEEEQEDEETSTLRLGEVINFIHKWRVELN
jgi:hypothetical protein